MWLEVYFAFINVINLSNIKKWDQPLLSLPNITLPMPLEDRDNISGVSFAETVSALDTHLLFSEMLNMKNNLSDFNNLSDVQTWGVVAAPV